MNGQQYSYDFESIFQICFSDIVAAVCILNELTILSLLFLWLLLMLFLMLLPNVRGLYVINKKQAKQHNEIDILISCIMDHYK